MKIIEIVTLRAAYDFTKGSKKFVKLSEIQAVCLPKKAPKQGWTYFGNWSKVKPYFHGDGSGYGDKDGSY